MLANEKKITRITEATKVVITPLGMYITEIKKYDQHTLAQILGLSNKEGSITNDDLKLKYLPFLPHP